MIASNSLEDFAQMVKNPYFRGLENDYVKMLRNMEMPEGAAKDIDFNAAPSAAQTMPDFNDPASTDFNEPEPDFCWKRVVCHFWITRFIPLSTQVSVSCIHLFFTILHEAIVWYVHVILFVNHIP